MVDIVPPSAQQQHSQPQHQQQQQQQAGAAEARAGEAHAPDVALSAEVRWRGGVNSPRRAADDAWARVRAHAQEAEDSKGATALLGSRR